MLQKRLHQDCNLPNTIGFKLLSSSLGSTADSRGSLLLNSAKFSRVAPNEGDRARCPGDEAKAIALTTRGLISPRVLLRSRCTDQARFQLDEFLWSLMKEIVIRTLPSSFSLESSSSSSPALATSISVDVRIGIESLLLSRSFVTNMRQEKTRDREATVPSSCVHHDAHVQYLNKVVPVHSHRHLTRSSLVTWRRRE
jgi:hypothetical protein